MNDFTLDRENPLPLYYQIRDHIRSKIVNMELKAGERLDPESELVKYYGTSRDTIRQALQILEMDGYIQRMRGKGTFITIPENRQFNEDMHRYIAVLIPDIAIYVFADILKSIEAVANSNGYDLLIYSTYGNIDNELKYIKYIIKKGVYGVILAPVLTSRTVNHYSALKKHNIPMVMIDQIISGFNTDYVATNNISGSYNAVDYLIKKGYKSIGHVAGPQIALSGRERFEGYKNALSDNNIPLDMQIVKFTRYTLESGYQATRQILDRGGVEAIYAANCAVAIGALKAIADAGMSVPEDIDVATFDAIEYSFYTHMMPSVMVANPSAEIGTKAMNILLQRIEEGNPSGQFETVILEPRLIVRGVDTLKSDASLLSASNMSFIAE